MTVNEEQFIWAEKYRPANVDDLIFPEKEKEKLRDWLDGGEVPNIGLWGSIPGTGKSSIMNVLIQELDVETLWINGSKDNGIDVMRTEITSFAKTRSAMGKHKLICIDEADYLTTAAQSTLRSDLENYSRNTRFVFTGNYPDKIIQPLMDRLQVFDLDDIYSRNKSELVKQIYFRLVHILENEEVEFDKKELTQVISTLYPSTRNMLMFLQKHTTSGKLEFDHISKPDDLFVSLTDAMKLRKFKNIKEAVNEIMIPDNFYTYVYKHLDEIFKPESQPMVILELADYQDYSQRAKNKHIPLLAFAVKIISDTGVKFK
jgi:DNA polymerase III delta prime subunit